MARTLRAKIQTFIIMKMNRCIVLVLPLLFMMVSCGTSAQFAQQRFQDGIYSRPEPVAEAVQIYSKDDFAAMAAANIAREAQQKDTVYVVLRNDDWYDSPWFAWGSAWALSWPYRWWAYSSWYDPWYGWARPWYDPWYSWYYDPWYWDPWYYRPHYHHYWHDHWYRPRPGLSSDGSYFYGPRFMTQGGGSMVSRPGSSGTRNYTRSYSSSGGNYGSAGATNIRRGTSAGGGNTSAVSRWNAGRGSSSGSVSRPSSTTNSTVNSGRRPNSNYNYPRSWSNSRSGSGTSTRSNSYTSPSRGNSSRSYTSPSRSYSGGSSFSSPSRSYGGGSGGGMRSGGGGSYSRGRR